MEVEVVVADVGAMAVGLVAEVGLAVGAVVV